MLVCCLEMALPGNYKYICLLGKKKKVTKNEKKSSTRKIFKTVESKGWGRFWGLEKLRLIVNGPAMDDTL